MRKLLIATIFISFTCFAGTIFAQEIHGIRIECNYPVEIFMDGQQISYPVHSTMICNIPKTDSIPFSIGLAPLISNSLLALRAEGNLRG